jgi:hydroxymethylpyrimidine/phosphomethylpyrimidine kinase
MADHSPNLLEAQTLLGFAPDHSREAAEEAATALQALCRTEIVLRAGDLGSYAHGWVPAYWTEENQHRVVDPTGEDGTDDANNRRRKRIRGRSMRWTNSEYG